MLANSIAPPRRSIDASENLVETWVFRTVAIESSINDLNTAVAAIKAAAREHDKTLIITRNSQTVVNSSTSNSAYNVRCAVRKVAADNDLEASQELELTFTFNIPMLQTDTDVWSQSYAGRKLVRVGQGLSPARRRLISITCVYTPTASATAKENFDSNHAAWCTAILAKTTGSGNMDDRLSAGAGTYDLISEQFGDMNRIDAEIRVTSVFQEIFEADSDSNTDEAALVDANWSFNRRHGSRFGRSLIAFGPTADSIPVTVVANYQASVSNTADQTGGSGGSSPWMLHEIFASKIRDILTSRARTQLDLHTAAWDVMRGPVQFNPTPSSRQLSANIELTFVRKNNQVITGPGSSTPGLWLEFDEEFNIELNAQNRYRKILDGGEDSYDKYTPGRLLTVSVTHTMLTFKAEGPEPPIFAAPWQMDRRSKRVKSWWVDVEDTRQWSGSDGEFTTQMQQKLYLTVYTTSYTLAVGGGRTAASGGTNFVAGERGPNDIFKMLA